MILLLSHGHPTFERHKHANLGRLIQPRMTSSIEATAAAGIPWAADNDCFQGLDANAYISMLHRIRELVGCLFVTVPDVVGDHETTRALFDEWMYRLGGWGLPWAFVLQNGCTSGDVPWGEIEAVFIGGDDAFKLGEDAEALAREAKARGKWVHMGRVNSAKRIRYAATIGCDSVDGTSWNRWVDRWLSWGLDLVSLSPQERLT